MNKVLMLKIFLVSYFVLSLSAVNAGYEEPTKITSFDLSETVTKTGFNNGKPTAFFIASFTGISTDAWKMRLDCPLPTTVSGLEERINIIKVGAVGVSSPTKEGEQCNVTQDGAKSLNQFSFLLINPFLTPQSVKFTLQAYWWDGQKNILGDTQSKTVVVLPPAS